MLPGCWKGLRILAHRTVNIRSVLRTSFRVVTHPNYTIRCTSLGHKLECIIIPVKFPRNGSQNVLVGCTHIPEYQWIQGHLPVRNSTAFYPKTPNMSISRKGCHTAQSDSESLHLLRRCRNPANSTHRCRFRVEHTIYQRFLG